MGMESEEIKTGKEVQDGECHYIIIEVPKAAVALEMKAVMLDDDLNQQIAVSTVTPSELRQARQDFLDEVGDDEFNVRYSLTEAGKELYKSIHETEGNGVQE